MTGSPGIKLYAEPLVNTKPFESWLCPMNVTLFRRDNPSFGAGTNGVPD